MSRTDNYMTMPTLSGSMTRSTKLYNWGDYMDYVMANAPMMDSVSASNMRHVAIINSNHPQDPLTETKRHERPLTLQLSLSRQLNSHWSLATGLSYTRMKSTFESGNENTIIHRTQRLHYLGIPLKLGYRVVGGNRWNLYTTGGVQLDIPVSARLTTQYIYGGSYAPIGNSPDIDATISAPWQWSVGVGIVRRRRHRRTVPDCAPSERLFRAESELLHSDLHRRGKLPHGASVRPFFAIRHQIYMVVVQSFRCPVDYISKKTFILTL